MKNRITGYYGLQTERKALIFLWEKVKCLFDKELSKVELYLSDYSKPISNQAFEDLSNIEILNIPMAQVSLLERIEDWINIKEKHPKTLFLGDQKVFRLISQDPSLVDRLFNRPELSHIKAIIWPSTDPDNVQCYIKMITLRGIDVIESMRVFNYDGNHDDLVVIAD